MWSECVCGGVFWSWSFAGFFSMFMICHLFIEQRPHLHEERAKEGHGGEGEGGRRRCLFACPDPRTSKHDYAFFFFVLPLLINYFMAHCAASIGMNEWMGWSLNERSHQFVVRTTGERETPPRAKLDTDEKDGGGLTNITMLRVLELLEMPTVTWHTVWNSSSIGPRPLLRPSCVDPHKQTHKHYFLFFLFL